MDERLLNVSSLSRYLSVSESTIRAWTRYGKIPYSKLGRCVRFDLHKINKWLKDKEIKECQRFHLDEV